MNLQAQISRQTAGQVPNQAGTSMSALPQQQNGTSISTQIQNAGGQCASPNVDSDFLKSRKFIQLKIYEFLMQRQQQTRQIPQKKVLDIVRRLEEGLLKFAATKDEYMNLETLENRLLFLIKRQPLSNQNQQFPQRLNSSSSVGTMIPTPGLPQSGNSSVIAPSSVDNSNMGGPLANGYQQPPSRISLISNGNNPANVQRIPSQMIPTPGFSNSNNNSRMNNNNNNDNNLLFMNPDSCSNKGVGYTNVESTKPLQQQKQHISGQNSSILHTLGTHIGGGMTSGLQQKSYEFSNGPGTSDNYLYGNSSNSLQQRQVLLGDGSGCDTADTSGSGNFFGPVAPAGSVMNNQNLDAGSLQSIHKLNSAQMTNQLNLHTAPQAANIKPSSSDQSEKVKFQSPHTLQQPHHFHQQELIQPQRQQKQLQGQQQQDHSFHQSPQLTSYPVNHQIKHEPGMNQHNNICSDTMQATQHFQSSEIPNQFQNNSMEDHPGVNQLLSRPPVRQDISSSSQTQQQHDLVADSQSVYTPQWQPRSQEGKSLLPGNLLHEHNIQEDFHHRISGGDEAQQNNLSSDGSIIPQTIVSSKIAEPPDSGGSTCRSRNLNRERQFKNQQRWLLFLRHARRCTAPAGKCPENNCINAQKLLGHMEGCNLPECTYPRCLMTRVLVIHHKRCRDPNCPVCVPVRDFLKQIQTSGTCPDSAASFPSSADGPSSKSSYDTTVAPAAAAGRMTSKMIQSVVAQTAEYLQPSLKRMKIEQQPTHSLLPECGSSFISLPAVDEQKNGLIGMTPNSEVIAVKREIPATRDAQESLNINQMNRNDVDNKHIQSFDKVPPLKSSDPDGFPKHESGIKIEKDKVQAKQENVTMPPSGATKSGKPEIKGVSLMELFTPDQVQEHIKGLRQWVGQSKAKVEKNQAMEHSMNENSCQLCAVEKLTFEPPPLYCTCGSRIKRNAMYYTIGSGDTRHFICIPCYNESRGDTISVDGTTLPKARLEKKKNDEETEEWWVQCDKCEAWQHQICALFNGRRNEGGAEYTCPNCYIQEIERGERMPLPQSAVLGAKDLPRTILSDHIEHRLFRRLKQERLERARVLGKNYDEVPGADDLVLRVVSSVDKKLDVKQRFLDIFQEDNYPTEFSYKSKVVLLFQKIEGVEVCLFGMYVQEFGSECAQPNHRRVYLSYLDSVKYFRPEIRTSTGEALRTFVYHEILIGYLEYCKERGFTSCYIWACPPLKGEDYILYCHPEIQKTPKSDKLREWYLAMLKKAAKEDIAVELVNLYDHFFVSSGECKAKVSAARLPYFDGDYWPGAAEDIIYQICQEDDGRKQLKKGTTKKFITKRALKASGQADLSGNASKDLLLMRKLGETISSMKEDFIMVHLQHACTYCCNLMVFGNRWVCNQCKKFQLCDKCYEAEQKLEERERHPINHREKHVLHPVEINNVPADTKDKDDILESEFFDTRQAFLSLCQGNHYQYDTLRRAKHSSMMVLYHLHNPTAPAFVISCYKCSQDVEAGQGWRCETCSDYDLCNACYQKDGGIDHPHKLTNYPSIAERDAQNKEAREQRVLQLRKMLDLLVHASQCRYPHCQYPNCRKVKGLFRHGIQCKIRVNGGCHLCKKMWYLLQLHARACKESQCHVPRCRDLKEHLRRLQQQADSRRRAAVMEMMRQRAAEVAGSS